jgi:hypothetical protein
MLLTESAIDELSLPSSCHRTVLVGGLADAL